MNLALNASWIPKRRIKGGIYMSKIKLHYACKNVNNCGDVLNLEICDKLFGKKCVYAVPLRCEAVFIGSVLEHLLYPYSNCLHKTYLGKWKKSVQVWGSGFIANPNEIIKRPNDMKEEFYRKLSIHAVRGNKTKERIEQILDKELKNVVLGDPGLLASELLKGKQIQTDCKIGIIPHYVERNENLDNIKVTGGKVIDICQESLKVIEEIAKCEMILSSSLHGLIIADSLGIPNARIVLSDKVLGGDYKYIDYYSAFGLDDHIKFDIRRKKIMQDDINFVIDNYSMKREEIKQKQKNLRDSFPFGRDNI